MMYFGRLSSRLKIIAPVHRNTTRNINALVKEDEYSVTPQYPPILDISVDARNKRKEQSWHEKIQCIKTVEEKLFEINVPKYYGWKSVILREGMVPYNSLPFAKFITRTYMYNELPSYSDVMNEEEVTSLLRQLTPQVERVLLFEYVYKRKNPKAKDGSKGSSAEDDKSTSSVIQHINRILLANLASRVPHLLESQVDYDPRVEAFWFAGGMNPPHVVKASRLGRSWTKHLADRPVDRAVQYLGQPVMQLRCRHLLRPVAPISQTEDVPHFSYDPRVLGFTTNYRHGTSVPGFWPGDPHEFGSVSFHSREHIKRQLQLRRDDDEADAVHTQAMLASHSWLLAQACYQGFSTFTELTYPMVTQTVVTDGQLWNFYVYQLNTTLLHGENTKTNPRVNLCWSSPTLKLFDCIEDGKILGFNEEVLRTLLLFYLNAPEARDGVNLRPYLGPAPHVADIEHDERRIWLEQHYKHMVSNRPRHRLPLELFHWQKIYKVDHKTRPMDKRLKLFALTDGNPFTLRRLDQHQPPYIPKVLRSEDEKKVKWRKTYYP